MDVKNLLGKLHAQEGEGEPAQGTPSAQGAPKTPKPPVPRIVPRAPNVEDRAPAPERYTGGSSMAREEHEDGIILDLGEGISLNIPIQKRMSLTDFIKLAEKVKALEMLSEGADVYRKGPL